MVLCLAKQRKNSSQLQALTNWLGHFRYGFCQCLYLQLLLSYVKVLLSWRDVTYSELTVRPEVTYSIAENRPCLSLTKVLKPAVYSKQPIVAAFPSCGITIISLIILMCVLVWYSYAVARLFLNTKAVLLCFWVFQLHVSIKHSSLSRLKCFQTRLQIKSSHWRVRALGCLIRTVSEKFTAKASSFAWENNTLPAAIHFSRAREVKSLMWIRDCAFQILLAII